MAYTGSKAQAGRGTSLSIGATVNITGSTTTGSASVTAVSSTTGLVVGQSVTGAGIPVGATIETIGSGTLTLSAAATATGSAVALVCGPIPIGELNDYPGARGKWKFTDTTNFQSGQDEEQLATIRGTANMTLKGNRVTSDAGQAAVEAAYQSGALQTFTAVLPLNTEITPPQTVKGDTFTFTAYVASSDFSIQPTKQIEFSVDLQTSGPGTWTYGS